MCEMAPMYREVNHDFFKKFSPLMSYVLGYFAADGAVIRNNRGAHFIEFHSTDRILITIVRTAIQSNHHIGIRIPKQGMPNQKTVYRLQIGSKEMYGDLQRLGFIQNKSNTMRFPVIPDTYVRHFVRRYFDGDGGVHFKKYFIKSRWKKRWVFSSRFTSGSRVFLIELHALLKQYGILGGFILSKSKASGFELVLSHRDSLALYRLMYNTAPGTDSYLPRKYKLFQRAIGTLYPKMRV